MSYIGATPAESYASFYVQHFTTSATTSYALDYPVVNENDLRLVINNVVQQPGSGKAYTAAASTLTLSAATTTADTMYTVFLGRALQTVNPPADSVGGTQLADSAISGQGALGAEPADTDEFLVSDAGTLKRMDYSYIKGGGGLLQIKETAYSVQDTLNSATYAEFNASYAVTITPTAADSSFLLNANVSLATTNHDTVCVLNMFDSQVGTTGSDNIFPDTAVSSGSRTLGYMMGNINLTSITGATSGIDKILNTEHVGGLYTPVSNNGSARTFSVCAKRNSVSNNVQINVCVSDAGNLCAGVSTISVMEIAGSIVS